MGSVFDHATHTFELNFGNADILFCYGNTPLAFPSILDNLLICFCPISSSASLFVFRFWPKMAKYAYYNESFLTHLISLKRVRRTRRIRTFYTRNNMTAFLSERYLSYNLSSKMTISHSRLAGTEIFQTTNMPEIFETGSLT